MDLYYVDKSVNIIHFKERKLEEDMVTSKDVSSDLFEDNNSNDGSKEDSNEYNKNINIMICSHTKVFGKAIRENLLLHIRRLFDLNIRSDNANNSIKFNDKPNEKFNDRINEESKDNYKSNANFNVSDIYLNNKSIYNKSSSMLFGDNKIKTELSK